MRRYLYDEYVSHIIARTEYISEAELTLAGSLLQRSGL